MSMYEPSPGGAGADHRGQDAERPEERAGVDPDGGVLGEVGEPLVVGGDVDDAGPRVVGHAVARVVAVGARHAVARDGAEHDLGVHGAQVVEPDAAPGQRAGPHRLDDGVGRGDQLLHDGDTRLGAQVEHQRPLAPVQVEVHERGALDDGPGHLADVVAGGRLDLDDLRPEVDQGRGDLRRPQGRALDDPHAVQRRRRRHQTSRRRRPDRSGRRHGRRGPDIAILGRWRRRPSMTP